MLFEDLAETPILREILSENRDFFSALVQVPDTKFYWDVPVPNKRKRQKQIENGHPVIEGTSTPSDETAVLELPSIAEWERSEAVRQGEERDWAEAKRRSAASQRDGGSLTTKQALEQIRAARSRSGSTAKVLKDLKDAMRESRAVRSSGRGARKELGA